MATTITMDGLIVPRSHWLSLGHSEMYAAAMEGLQLSLIEGILKIKLHSASNGMLAVEGTSNPVQNSEKNEVHICIGKYSDVDELPEGLLMHDAKLLPLWQQFVDTIHDLCRCRIVPNLRLLIAHTELSCDLIDILAPALKEAPLKDLALLNNNLGSDGVLFVTRVLEANPSITLLHISKNDIECERDALHSLAKTASNHPNLGTFHLGSCSINNQVLSTILPPIFNLFQVDLRQSNIGSHGASLISSCLATNPKVRLLNLSDNSFSDDDATLIANSLRTNTHLMKLSLGGNNFTETGFNTLISAIYDDESLNAIHDSNSMCQLVLFKEGDIITSNVDPSVLDLNKESRKLGVKNSPASMLRRCVKVANGDTSTIRGMLWIAGSRRVKILHALQAGGETGLINIQYLKDVPVEVMPMVLAYLQEGGKWTGTEERNLDRVFQVIRSMPEVAMPCDAGKECILCSESPNIAIAAVVLVSVSFWCAWLMLFFAK